MHLLVLGGTIGQRLATVLARTAPARLIALDAASLPFTRATRAVLPPSPGVLLLENLELAFPENQTGGVRLVLTQSPYLMQAWLDVLDPADRIVATADRAAFERRAPDALQRRSPWAQFEICNLDDASAVERDAARETHVESSSKSPDPVLALLVRAYSSRLPAERVALCREALALDSNSAVAALALASACREQQDMTGARAALDRAMYLAPDWAAVHFEFGKFWLGCDDAKRARDGFQRACDLMPTFVAAFGNLGATLGELNAPEAALAALTHGLALDPRNHSLLNNVGVVTRELGRLDESEATFRRLLEIVPGFAFGYYNLGHTLLLNGKYPQAVAAYEEGQRRDPGKNRRQACRLAMARFACRDLEGATRDFWHAVNEAPPGERADLVAEAHEIASALQANHPDLDPDGTFLARLDREPAQPVPPDPSKDTTSGFITSAGGRERGAPTGAEPCPVTSAVRRAPGGAVRGQDPGGL